MSWGFYLVPKNASKVYGETLKPSNIVEFNGIASTWSWSWSWSSSSSSSSSSSMAFSIINIYQPSILGIPHFRKPPYHLISSWSKNKSDLRPSRSRSRLRPWNAQGHLQEAHASLEDQIHSWGAKMGTQDIQQNMGKIWAKLPSGKLT